MKLSKYTGLLGCTRSLGNLHPTGEPRLTKSGTPHAQKTKAVELRMREAAAALPLNIWHPGKEST